MKYTLRTHPDYTLTVDGRAYRNGDAIEIDARRAAAIAGASRWHRFEPEADGPTIGQDRHRSGRIPPRDSDQAPKDTTTTE